MIKTFMRIGFALGAFAMLFATACEEVAPDELNFKVSPLSVSIAAEGGSAEVQAEIPLAWSVSFQADWLRMAPTSGDKGTYTLVFSAQKNDTGETRTATAVVSVQNTQETDFQPITITVIQTSVAVVPPTPDPALSFSNGTSFHLDEKGGTVRFTVTSNVPWTLENSLSDFTVTPTSGQAGETGVVVTVPANTVEKERTAVLTFKYADKTAQVSITQDAATPAPPEPQLTISPSNSITAGYEGGSFTLTVTSNVEWTASKEAEDVSIRPTSGSAGTTTVVSAVAENKVEKVRETRVTFTYSGKTAVVTITQAAAPHQDNPAVGVGGEINGWEYGGTITFEETEI